MASSMSKVFLNTLENTKTKYISFYNVVRHSSALPVRKAKLGTVKNRNIIASSCESLSARGFLRSQKAYTPDVNVTEKVKSICYKVLGNNYNENCPLSRENKFELLSTCFEELNHSVPNSLLHKIVNAKDVIHFYETPVSTTVPYDELKNNELPPNLHIQYDYVRFHPETDVKFKGISAFPRSSTIVTGLKYKEKYKGHKTKSPFLDTEVCFDKENPFV